MRRKRLIGAGLPVAYGMVDRFDRIDRYPEIDVGPVVLVCETETFDGSSGSYSRTGGYTDEFGDHTDADVAFVVFGGFTLDLEFVGPGHSEFHYGVGRIAPAVSVGTDDIRVSAELTGTTFTAGDLIDVEIFTRVNQLPSGFNDDDGLAWQVRFSWEEGTGGFDANLYLYSFGEDPAQEVFGFGTIADHPVPGDRLGMEISGDAPDELTISALVNGSAIWTLEPADMTSALADVNIPEEWPTSQGGAVGIAVTSADVNVNPSLNLILDDYEICALN